MPVGLRKPIPSFGSGLPLGLVGMLALVLVAEMSIRWHSHVFEMPAAANWRRTGEDVGRESLRTDILCFGDSMIKFAIMPQILDRHLGHSAYNFGIYGGGPTTSYYLLKRSLATGHRPAAIFLDLPPETLLCDHSIRTHLMAELLTSQECVDLACTARDPALLVNLLVDQLLPSARFRHDLRASVVAALQNQSTSLSLGHRIRDRNWAANRGAEVYPAHPYFNGTIPSNYALFFERWESLPLNTLYVRRFMSLAAAHHIPVFWLLLPYAPPVQQRRDRTGGDVPFDRFVASVLGRFPNLRVIDWRHAGFPSTAFFDAVHLNGQGASVLSNDLSDLLQAYLGAPTECPAWMHPHRYLELPIDESLEDLGESYLVLDHDDRLLRR